MCKFYRSVVQKRFLRIKVRNSDEGGNFRMMIQRQRGLWGCGELSRCAPSTLPLSPASLLSRELVSNGPLPLCEAVGWPRPRTGHPSGLDGNTFGCDKESDDYQQTTRFNLPRYACRSNQLTPYGPITSLSHSDGVGVNGLSTPGAPYHNE